MDISVLKREIINGEKIPVILEQLGCHSIRRHSGSEDDYYTCGNPDGDNTSAITVYCNTGIKVINYTRELNAKKDDHDIIDLVQYIKKCSFFEALKWLCDVAGVDYYGMENDDQLPESVKLARFIMGMSTHDDNEYDEDVRIEPKPEHILSYYGRYVNDLFKDDGVSYKTQLLFEMGYDDDENLITIPIRDEIGNLIGVKGRVPDKNVTSNKYTYLIRCPRGKALYNLNRAYRFIQEKGFVIVVESEKSCMQLYDMGVYNVIALSGSKLTKTQLQKILKLQVDVVFAFDKDITLDKLQAMAGRFPRGYRVYALYDDKNILNEKESPSDNPEKWNALWENMVRLV